MMEPLQRKRNREGAAKATVLECQSLFKVEDTVFREGFHGDGHER
jgi:hypothetical protein